MELFHSLPGLWSKNSFTKCLSFDPMGLTFSKQEIELFFPLQGLSSKNFFYICFSFDPRGSNFILQQKMELSRQQIELLLPLSDLWLKEIFYQMFLIWSKVFKIKLELLGSNVEHFVIEVFDKRPEIGGYSSISVWIIPFPVFKTNFKHLGPNETHLITDFF